MANIQVMGTGCKKCHQLYENAVEALGGDAVEYVTDMERIAEAGIMTLPALVVDGKPVSAGKVLKPAQISALVNG
ncbi:MAG: thioredoxin family protein [Eggerthellaceae bacterium]|jgi:small redox-active disulfide protein 2